MKIAQKQSIEELLQTPCWIIDILPEQVPRDSQGQYFKIERCFMKEPQRTAVKQKHINLVLKVNCYKDLSLDERQTFNPSPEQIAEKLNTSTTFIMMDDAMLLSEPDDTYMTLFNPNESLLRLIRVLAGGEGLYVWNPKRTE